MKHELHRPTRISITRDVARLVCGYSPFQIVRMPCVVGAVGTAEDVDVEAHGGRARSPFDWLRVSGRRAVDDLVVFEGVQRLGGLHVV